VLENVKMIKTNLVTRLFYAKNRKLVFRLFLAILGPYEFPSNGSRKVYKGLQVVGMYGPMCEPKHNLLKKSLDPFLYDELFKTTRKQYVTIVKNTPYLKKCFLGVKVGLE
jgi:hypothetical protein